MGWDPVCTIVGNAAGIIGFSGASSTGSPAGRLTSWQRLVESFETSAGLISERDTNVVKRIDANGVVKLEERGERLLSAVRSYRRSRDTYRCINISGARLKAHAPRENRRSALLLEYFQLGTSTKSTTGPIRRRFLFPK